MTEDLAAGAPDARIIGRDEMARDVRVALQATPRSLPCKYLYDERGSALFEQITRLPEYYQTRTEMSILRDRAADIMAAVRPSELVEIGSGPGRKIETLIDAGLAAGCVERSILFDISASFIESSIRRLSREYADLDVRGVLGQFPDDLARLGRARDRLLLFLGGTIGNLHPDAVPGFLNQVRTRMEAGDAFLVGLDLVKDVGRLEAAYNDSAGVTARFNLNLLDVVNRELGADFDPAAFEHVAFYDADKAWIDIRVRALRRQRVHVTAAGLLLDLAPGEDIRTEISCKYTRETWCRRLEGTDLELADWFTDAADDFALALLRPSRAPGDGAA